MVYGGARAGFALLPAPCREDAPAAEEETERRRTWGWVSCGHLSWDLIGSMSSPHSRELRKPSRSHERGRAQKPEWHSARHWSAALLESGELAAIEREDTAVPSH